eukprot:CAMPEP_0180557062 /NCGR_PEP_ID=MMETSP1037_2-20121125/955_1 /TAXON_ID=632150 /ORGANISM="Azadinium spinosum, Strain 3D9" /LENGTH=392 /DNA_ID=CAMNT_0022573227 /DNA_START=174 /DNA_END=1354 /DNA_ORIENTATION=+
MARSSSSISAIIDSLSGGGFRHSSSASPTGLMPSTPKMMQSWLRTGSDLYSALESTSSLRATVPSKAQSSSGGLSDALRLAPSDNTSKAVLPSKSWQSGSPWASTKSVAIWTASAVDTFSPATSQRMCKGVLPFHPTCSRPHSQATPSAVDRAEGSQHTQHRPFSPLCTTPDCPSFPGRALQPSGNRGKTPDPVPEGKQPVLLAIHALRCIRVREWHGSCQQLFAAHGVALEQPCLIIDGEATRLLDWVEVHDTHLPHEPEQNLRELRMAPKLGLVPRPLQHGDHKEPHPSACPEPEEGVELLHPSKLLAAADKSDEEKRPRTTHVTCVPAKDTQAIDAALDLITIHNWVMVREGVDGRAMVVEDDIGILRWAHIQYAVGVVEKLEVMPQEK